eukprot:gene5198-10397_t
MDAQDPTRWFFEIPIVTRLYLCAAVATTTACFLDFVSPLTLYYNYELIFSKGQYWRVLTSFLFFGTFSLDFLFHMYFLVRYSRLLEEGFFRGRTADFLFMLLFGSSIMIILGCVIPAFSKIKFLGHPLAFMMVYVWGRCPENANARMSFLGLFVFNAPYLAWVLLLFSLFLGNPVETDIVGIIPGHLYYFFEFVYPHVADIRGWSVRKPLKTPVIFHYLCGSVPMSTRIIQAPLMNLPNNLQGNIIQNDNNNNIMDNNNNNNNINQNVLNARGDAPNNHEHED